MVRRLFFAVVVCAGLASASSADARTPHDPCHGDGASLQYANGVVTRACYPKFQAPPGHSVDRGANSASCPNGYRLPGSDRSAGLAFDDWDYWTYNGEWVTWALAGDNARSAYTFDGHPAAGESGIYPFFHNWSPWGWGVRTFTGCAPIASALAAMAHTMVAEPVQDIRRGNDRDNVIHGGQGDDTEIGGPGHDQLHGGPGADELFDDQGRDTLDGGPG